MITSAGMINAMEISGKDISKIKIVVSGAGAAGIACAKMYKALGAKHIVMIDSKGVIHSKRTDLTPEKVEFALETEDRTLADAMRGADMFLGLSKPGVLTKEMVASMNKEPIIFALANPVPEIFPEDVVAVRDDVMMGTGRSDRPNQINNVLAFPGIFRGALDAHARDINYTMKKAAARAVADYIKPEDLNPENIIPSALDKSVAKAVADAVVLSGRVPVFCAPYTCTKPNAVSASSAFWALNVCPS